MRMEDVPLPANSICVAALDANRRSTPSLPSSDGGERGGGNLRIPRVHRGRGGGAKLGEKSTSANEGESFTSDSLSSLPSPPPSEGAYPEGIFPPPSAPPRPVPEMRSRVAKRTFAIYDLRRYDYGEISRKSVPPIRVRGGGSGGVESAR